MTVGSTAQITDGQGPSDEELMSSLAAGHREAIGPLHGRYAGLVYNLAARALGTAVAEEVVQEVFLTIWSKAGKFDPKVGTFRSWALQIARNRVLNEIRTRGRRPQFDHDANGLEIGGFADPMPGPEEVAWLEHRRAAVRAAIDALPTPQRQALSLAFLEDLTHQQVAEFLDVPTGTAKTRIRSGLQTLRLRLAPLMAICVLIAGLIVVAVIRDRTLNKTIGRDEAALRLVTASDIVPLRLTAAAGVPAEAHGNYRGRNGSAIAVLTVSHLSPPMKGSVYRAWGLFDGRWYLLGTVNPGSDGKDLLVIEGNHLVTLPTMVQVTMEPLREESLAPGGSSVIRWPNP